tara:strand:+ start:317 stop:727 length:411 start_codon:yes stop_codon:yes gene_type:complete
MSDIKLIMENWDKFMNEGPNFDNTTGKPLTDKGRELCAKRPECREKHLTVYADEENDAMVFRPLRHAPGSLSMEDREATAQRLRKMWFDFSKELQDLGNHPDENVAMLADAIRQTDQHVEYGMRLNKVLDMIAGKL